MNYMEFIAVMAGSVALQNNLETSKLLQQIKKKLIATFEEKETETRWPVWQLLSEVQLLTPLLSPELSC